MTAAPAPGLGHRIVRASLAIAVAHALFKLASLFQAMVLGHFLPAGTYEVVCGFAFDGVVFTLFLIGEEAIGPAFLPVFMREMDTAGESAAWRFANVILTLQLIVVLTAVALLMAFPEWVVGLMTAWEPGAHYDPARYALAVGSVRWIAPALVGLSIASTTYVILNGYKRFFLAAFGDAAWRLCVLACVLVGMGFMGFGYRSVVVGFLAGSVLKLLTHLCGLLRELPRFRFSVAWRQPAVRQMALLMLPLLAGILFAKFRDNFNNVYILSWLDSAGLIQANSFGRKPLGTIGFMVPYAISIAMFPFLCELVDRKDMARFGSILTDSSRMLLAVFIPLSFVIAVLAHPIVSFLFEGGEFGAVAVRRTTISTACYMLVLPAYSLEYLLMQAFFANRRMISITVIGIVFSVLSIGISYTGIMLLGARGLAALVVVALGYVLSRILKTTTLILLLRRTVPCFPFRETATFLVRTIGVGGLAAGGAWLAILGVGGVMADSQARVLALAQLSAAGLAALVLFGVGSRFLGLSEPFDMITWALRWRRERRDRRASPPPGPG